MNYAELHCKTNFSFLEGASHAEELVAQAARLGYTALAITDRNSLAGVVRAHTAAKEHGIKLLIGVEITPHDAAPVVLLATDRAAYGRLSRLITRGRRNAEKGQCQLTLDDIDEYSVGLIACVISPAAGKLVGDSALAEYREIFRKRCYLLAELHRGIADERRLEELSHLAARVSVPLVAAGDVHYHIAARLPLEHVLTAIRHGTTVAEAGERLFPNARRHLKLLEDIRTTFAQVPQAIRHTVEIADRCTFSLDQLRYDYPVELAPAGETPMEYLRRITHQGSIERYPRGVPDKVRRLIEHELGLIEELRYEAYFLTIWDLVCFARSRGILCQGRGSAANSAVCYCLDITSVDPERMNVLFERFISRERNEPPDIDVDFEHERREEVLQYLYDKYGRERAGMTAEVISYRPRSAVRDVGKALGLSLDRVDALAKNLEGYSQEPKLAERCRMCGIDPESQVGRELVSLVEQIIGFPRHLSQHVGGMVITDSPLCELVPIENAAMDGRTVIEWNKDDLDELGILKIDCLSLGMLTAIRKCFTLIEQHTARRLTLATIPPEDPRVYDMICRADTMGVFQIESRAQMSMLPRLRPRCYYDLVVEVAIVRPGPIQGQMVHPYLRRRNGEEAITYPNDAIREVLEKTLGIPLFQEQAMRLAMVAAGFTAGEADQLRRAMGAWRRPGIIHQFREKLLGGMRAGGLSEEFALRVFKQIQGFGEYGFPESHAASFALLVYVSAWLKCHHPAAFTAAVINSQPMGFYAPAQLVRNARNGGVEIRPADVNHSNWDCTLEETGDAKGPWALRLGLRMIRSLPRAVATAIEQARTTPYRSLADLTHRCRLNRKVLERLADADAFGSLGLDRRTALWQAVDQESRVQAMPLFDAIHSEQEPSPRLPKVSDHDEVFADYRATGLTLRSHPLTFYRAELDSLGTIPAGQLSALKHGQQVRVAGLVLLRQRPSTAKGITFVTLEDETGMANLVIHQQTWNRYDRIARTANVMLAHGRLERKDQVIHVVVSQLRDLKDRLQEVGNRSRDFR